MPRRARAQAYPSRPSCVAIGYAVVGSTDIVGCRRLAERLGELPTLRNAPNNTPAEMIETLNREVPVQLAHAFARVSSKPAVDGPTGLQFRAADRR